LNPGGSILIQSFTGAFMKALLSFTVIVFFLSACGGTDVADIKSDTKQLVINFNDSVDGWKAGFADYTANETDYEFASGQATVPAPLDPSVSLLSPLTQVKGFRLRSHNRSDDMFMFITKYYDGLEANRLYDFDFEVTFATNAQKNCVGIGGAPGEAVTIKAGASKLEPKAVNLGNNFYAMNIDKGNQALGGLDAVALGNFANDRECGSPITSYMNKTLRSDRGRFSAYTDASGGIWLLMGTDSGYEGITDIYFLSAKVWATP
jgi:hypothetical protein